MTTETTPRRFYSWSETQKRTTYGKTTLWRLQKQGKFPKAITLPDTRRSVFVADEVDAYIEAQITARNRSAR